MIFYLLAVLGAMANASSSVLQRKADLDEPATVSFSLRMILDLLHRPVWLAGILSITLGFIFQAGALSGRPLAVVEPILLLELPFTLTIGAMVFHTNTQRRDWVAALAMTAGLGLLIRSLTPTGGSAENVSRIDWTLGIGLSLALIATLVALGRSRHQVARVPRATLLGLATGTTFGLTAALMTAMSEVLAQHFLTIFTIWQTYVLVVTGCAGVYLFQNTMQAGTLLAAQTAITLSDPLVSIFWGVAVFREHVTLGVWLLGSVTGAILIVGGTILLADLMPSQSQPSLGRTEARGQYRPNQ